MDASQQTVIAGGADPGYKTLYSIGAVAALLIVAIMAISVAGFVLWPYAAGSSSTEELFELVRRSLPAGLIALDIGVSTGNLLAILLYLALYQALKRSDPSLALIALAFGLVAGAALIAARPVAEIFELSRHFSSVTDLAEQNRLLAAGDALLVQFHGMAFKNYLLLGNGSLIISAYLMLRSPHFGRVTACVGMVSYAVGLGFLLPTVGAFFAFVAMPGQAIWLVLVSRVLFRIGRQSA